jgi:hypothetical protein
MSWKHNVRLLGRSVLPLAIGFLLASSASAQHVTGLAVQKSCPAQVAPSTAFQCTFSIQNLDPQHGVITLAVTNTVPFPGGTTSPASCTQGGNPVTALGVNGTPTDTCTGVVDETSPPCTSTTINFVDQVSASGEDAGIAGLPVTGSASNSTQILACTPTPTPTDTPTNTPTNTPTTVDTPTPTNTPTDTPTNTPTATAPPSAPPPVPTLSFPMMVVLGLMLAGAGLFLARRS